MLSQSINVTDRQTDGRTLYWLHKRDKECRAKNQNNDYDHYLQTEELLFCAGEACVQTSIALWRMRRKIMSSKDNMNNNPRVGDSQSVVYKPVTLYDTLPVDDSAKSTGQAFF